MSPDSTIAFLDQLTLKTREKKVNWDRTSKTNSYKSSLKTGNVIIEQIDGRAQLIAMGGATTYFNFTVYNDKGDKVLEQSTGGIGAIFSKNSDPYFDKICQKISDLFSIIQDTSGNNLKNMLDELLSL